MSGFRLNLDSEVYDSTNQGWLALEELRGIITYRDLIQQLIRRDVITRYKRSALGFAWTMLNPLGTMLILTLVFSNLFQNVRGYSTYILCGLIAWNFFSQSTTASLSQNVWGGSLLHRIYVPRTAFTVAAIGTGLVNLLLSIVPLVIIMVITGQTLHISLTFLPISILILACFTLGIALIFSTLALYFPDVVEMYHIALTAWMYLTPIIYPVEILPNKLHFWLLKMNPMYYLVEIFRQPVYEGVFPRLSVLVPGGLIAVFTLILGWLLFSWKANEFTYLT